MNSIDRGFDTHSLVMMKVDPTLAGNYNDIRLRYFHDELLTRISVLPGIDAATLARTPPLNMSGWGTSLRILDKVGTNEEHFSSQFNTVAVNYFEVMGIPVLVGRSFLPQDGPSAPRVAIVNATFARNVWGMENAVGKMIQVESEQQPRLIIGVVGDIKYRTLLELSQNYIYYPMSQPYPMPRAPTTILVRTELPLKQTADAVRHELEVLDPNVTLFGLKNYGRTDR